MIWNKKELYQYFNKDDKLVIIDVGAAFGNDTIEFKYLFPNAKVFGIEVYESVFNKLSNNKSIIAFKIAISDKSGKELFYPCSQRQGSLLKPISSEINYGKPFYVETITLDEWSKNQSLDNIDILWIDTNGGEYKVLRGLGDLRPKIIFLETYYIRKHKDVKIFGELDEYLESIGYKLLKRIPINNEWGNALYIHKEFT